MRNPVLPWLVVLLALVPAATTLAADGELEHVTTVEGISEYRLDNGLKVLLMPDSSRPTTTINITYFVGSKHESYGETGMAHLLEHMVFYGTEKHEDIKAEISERGGFANGTTWYDRTNYFQTLPAGEENLEWALAMEADRMVNSRIDGKDLESEMTVVRNEFEIGENSPFRVLMQRVMAAAYEWHGYGRSTIGARADIENVPVERLQSFYRRYYQPDNAMLVLSGNFDVDSTRALIERHFGAIPAPERSGDMKLWPTYTREPVQDGPRSVTVRRSGEIQMLMGAWHIPPAAHEDYPAVEVLAHLLGDAPSGRLHQALVKSGMASRVGAMPFTLGEPSILMLFAQLPTEQDLDEARSTMLATIEALESRPPTEEEVTRAINALTRNVEMTLNDSNRVGIQLSEWAAAGDWRLMFLNRDRLETVGVDDVRRVATAYLRRDNRTIGQFIPDSEPQRAELPEAPDLESVLADYRGRNDRAAGEAFEPTPENIEARLVEFELPNGARVALLPKQTRGNRIDGQITMRLGNLETLRGLGAVPEFAGSMLMRGSQDHSRQEIRDRVSELQSGLNIRGSTIVTAAMETRREHLADLLDVAADVLRNPVFDEGELDELRRQRLSQIDQQRDDPGAVASRLLASHFNVHPEDHPDYTPTLDEEAQRVRQVTREQLADFHRRFYGFGPGTTISFVGDFDPDELRRSIEAHFADWTAPTRFERYATAFADIEPNVLEHQLDDKANAVLIGRQNLRMRDDHPDYPALSLAGHLLGGGFLSSRLADRIRDTEGLSYGVGAGINAHSIDERGTFSVFAMYAPENRERLVEVLFEELQQAVEQGFGTEEVERGRRGYLQQLNLMRSDDGRLMGMLNENLYLGRTMQHQAEFEQQVGALTAEQVTAAVRRHLDPEQLSYATAGDFDSEEGE